MKLQFALLFATSVICGLVHGTSETAKSDVVLTSSVGTSSASSAATSAIAPGPEARQVPSSVSAGSNSPVYPYNLYQNSLYSNGYDGSSSGPSASSMLSFLRSPQGGRRSSLTNRLRNLMNAIFFRRESNSPYMTAGSSYSYSFRQPPPFGFSSGLSSSLPSGYSPSSSNNFLSAAASAYRPVVFPNYPGSGSSSGSSGGSGGSTWSNYKQWPQSGGSSGSPLASSIGSSGSPGGTNYAWMSSSGLNSPGSILASSLAGSPSSSSVYSSPGSSGFQVAASNSYPSSYPSVSSSYSGSSSNTPYQRSSNSNFKPVANSPISSSSSSSSGNPSSTNFKQ